VVVDAKSVNPSNHVTMDAPEMGVRVLVLKKIAPVSVVVQVVIVEIMNVAPKRENRRCPDGAMSVLPVPTNHQQ
tara:strand:+ start:410 stop:631 length:222 start_codon:yes stop_codon:yes gene_type:complete